MNEIEQIKQHITADPNRFLSPMRFARFGGGWRSQQHTNGETDRQHGFVSYLYDGKVSITDHARGTMGVIDVFCALHNLTFADGVAELKKQIGVVTSSIAEPPTPPTPANKPQRYYTNQAEVRAECVQTLKISTPLHEWLQTLCTEADKGRERAYKQPLFFAERLQKILHAYVLGGNQKNGKQYTCFWYVDSDGVIQARKDVVYTHEGKRNRRDKYSIVTHNSPICLFGEHFLRDKTKDDKEPVIIVESEKTAILCALIWHGYLWLSCGGANYLRRAINRQCLKGRSVYVCADADKVNEWREEITRHNQQHAEDMPVRLINDFDTPFTRLSDKSDIGDKVVDYLEQQSKLKPHQDLITLSQKNSEILDCLRLMELYHADPF